MNKPEYKKITQSLNYIASKYEGKVNYMKALKLLYFSDRLHLREYGRLITDDNLIAMKNGTLGSQSKNIATLSDFLPHVAYKYAEKKLKRGGEYEIEANSPERAELSDSDTECIDKVCSMLGSKNQFELGKLTHDLPEWKKNQYLIEQEGKKVVELDILDLFKPTSNETLNKIYNQSEKQLDLSRELFTESLEHKSQLA
jgi:hypothetical protein